MDYNNIYIIFLGRKISLSLRETEAATRDVLQKKLLLKTSQYSHEKTCAGVSF